VFEHKADECVIEGLCFESLCQQALALALAVSMEAGASNPAVSPFVPSLPKSLAKA